MQARLNKEDLRIELSVAALRKQTKKAGQMAADLEVSLGEHVTPPVAPLDQHHQTKGTLVCTRSCAWRCMTPYNQRLIRWFSLVCQLLQ